MPLTALAAIVYSRYDQARFLPTGPYTGQLRTHDLWLRIVLSPCWPLISPFSFSSRRAFLVGRPIICGDVFPLPPSSKGHPLFPPRKPPVNSHTGACRQQFYFKATPPDSVPQGLYLSPSGHFKKKSSVAELLSICLCLLRTALLTASGAGISLGKGSSPLSPHRSFPIRDWLLIGK